MNFAMRRNAYASINTKTHTRGENNKKKKNLLRKNNKKKKNIVSLNIFFFSLKKFHQKIFFFFLHGFGVYCQCRTVFLTDCYKKLLDGKHKQPLLFFARCDVKNHKAETAEIVYVSNNNSLVRCKINLR